MFNASLIWWLTLAISMIPFSYGLIYLWLRVDQGKATVVVPPGWTFSGSTGFTIFALGLAGCAYSSWNLIPPDPPSRPLTGTVRQVDRIPPLAPGSVDAPQIARWLEAFQRGVRISVATNGWPDLQNGDSIVTLSATAPKRLPDNLGNLDSDMTALLRASGGNGVDVKAILDSYPSEEAAGQALGSGARVTARNRLFERLQPVWSGQRVVLIGHDETSARDRLHDVVRDAKTASLSDRPPILRRLIILADEFIWEHRRGFFAAEILLAKAEAHGQLGDVEAAIASYRRFKRSFPANPASTRVDERIERLIGEAEHDVVTVGGVTARLASSASESKIPASKIAVSASSVLPPRGRVDYSAANVLDGDPGTAWSEGAKGTGAGETLRFSFPRAYPVRALTVTNGNPESPALFGRIRRVQIKTDLGRPFNLRLADTSSPQTLRFAVHKTRRLELTILGTYPGTFPHATLSEAEILTR